MDLRVENMNSKKKVGKFELPSGFTSRCATLADAQIVTDMLNAESLATIGKTQFSFEECHQEWSIPGFDLEKSSVIVIAPNGQVAGYTEVDDLTAEMPVRPFVFGATHPDFWGMGIGTWMLAWSEKTLERAVSLVPDGTQVAMEAASYRTVTQGIKMFEGYGMRPKRSYFRMLIDLDEKQHANAPVDLDGLSLVTLAEYGDIPAAALAKEDGWKDHYGHVERSAELAIKQFEHVVADAAVDHDLVYLLLDGDDVAALIINVLKADEQPDIGYVRTLVVRKPWRRRGLGKYLLEKSFNAFYERGGFKQVALDVDAESLTGATDLYLKAGMRVERENVLFEKILQAGENLSTVD